MRQRTRAPIPASGQLQKEKENRSGQPSLREPLNCLDLGSIGLEEAAEWVTRVLETSGYRVRSVRRYDRMIKIRLGLLKGVYLVRYESMRKTVVCGSRDALGALRMHGALAEYKPRPVADRRGEILIEAQALERKARWARNDLLISTAIIAGLATILTLAGAHLLTYIILLVMILITDLVPRPVPYTGKTEFYIPMMYPIYKARLRQIRNEVNG